MTLWTAADAAAATGGQVSDNWSATGVSIDTRTLVPGDLFVALSAARDGHDFVAQALEAGASAALVSRVPEGVSPAKLLVVRDVLTGLEDLGRAARARTQARVVGITGSVGKTSTKEMLRDVLTPQGRTHVAQASYNNHWGVPLTLARMPAETEYAVIEIGMNHPGEIAPLAQMAQPHVIMITSIAAAHLEAFDNLEGIAEEKISIVSGLMPKGTAVLNMDTDHADLLISRARAAGAQIVTFGLNGDQPLDSLRIVADTTIVGTQIDGAAALIKLNTPGRHFGMNGLGVLAVVGALGADKGRAVLDLGRWSPPEGRGKCEVVSLDPADEQLSFSMIDDAFNANPASVAAALEVLAAAQPTEIKSRAMRGRRIAVLGDMLEIGETEQAEHAAIAQIAHISSVQIVHCVGHRMRHLYDALPLEQRGQWFETAADASAQSHDLVSAGDVILIKGSMGSAVSRVVDALRKLGHPRSKRLET